MATLISNLLTYGKCNGCRRHVLLTKDRNCSDVPTTSPLGADSEDAVDYWSRTENLEKILQRINRRIPPGEGVLVANDWIELAALTRQDSGRTVLQIVHGDYDYYYQLATRHEPIIDGFITHTRVIYEKLRQTLPARSESIFYLPYGVPIPPQPRTPVTGPLRLLFVGRLTPNKGVMELPSIDECLLKEGIQPQWTIVGEGESGPALCARWSGPRIAFRGALPNSEVLRVYPKHDILVLPTRFEGFPVCLLEAMAAGVVPVISNIPGGVQEVVRHGITGFLPDVSDSAGFADSIAQLHSQRARLEVMSNSARELVAAHFDIRQRITAYQDLYARWRELRRARPGNLDFPYGSRLDRKWVPNWLTRTVRTLRTQFAMSTGVVGDP